MQINSTTWRAARRALEKAVALYIEDPDVAFIDLGFRTPSSQNTALAVRIHRRCQPSGVAVPDLGFPVEVVESNFRFHLRRETAGTAPSTSSELSGGAAIANAAGRVFTLGGKVRDRQTGEAMLLSCWHVLADAWARGENVLIYRAAAPENSSREMLAELARSTISRGLDAAVSRLQSRENLRNEQQGLGAVTGVVLPQLGMRVQKSGAGSGVTAGVVTGILGYSMQRYVNRQQLLGPLVCITPENSAEKISASGDSGAWWLESATRRAVALHFAGGQQNFALAFSMPEVLEALDVEIDTTIAPAVIAPAMPAPAEAPKTIAAAPVATETSAAPKVDGSTSETALIASPVKDVILTADFEVLDADEPKSEEPLQRLLWNALKSMAQRCNVASARRVVYRLTQVTLVVAAAMTMIGFNRRMTHEQQQRDGQIAQLHKQLQSIKVIAKIDSARQQELFRIVAIIDRYNPDLNSEIKLALAAEILAMSQRYPRLEVALICAVITHESAKTWNPEVTSAAGAIGLMQLLPSTADDLAKEEGIAWTSPEAVLYNPIYNVRLGCRYLASLITEYGLEGGLAGYNGGPVQAKRWLRKDNALHPETAFYVPEVMKKYRAFQQARQQDATEIVTVENFSKG